MVAFDYNQILEAITTTGAVGRALTADENDGLRRALLQKFGTGHSDWRLWRQLVDTVGVQDPDGWLKLSSYLPAEPVFLLVDDSSWGAYGFALESGQAVVPILGETKHFEFSITNRALDFVICFNSYDFLITCGTATDWARQLLESRQE